MLMDPTDFTPKAMATSVPRFPYYSCMVLLVLVCASTHPVLAQTHFEVPPGRTGNNATIIVPVSAVAFEDSPALQPGDEIGILNGEGHCVGASVWTGENIAITIWGNNELTDEVDGLRMDESFTLSVWRTAVEKKISTADGRLSVSLASDRPYYRGEATYAPNAIYVVEHLRLQPFDDRDVTKR